MVIIGDLLGSAAWQATEPTTLRDKLSCVSEHLLAAPSQIASPLVLIHGQIVMPITTGTAREQAGRWAGAGLTTCRRRAQSLDRGAG